VPGDRRTALLYLIVWLILFLSSTNVWPVLLQRFNELVRVRAMGIWGYTNPQNSNGERMSCYRSTVMIRTREPIPFGGCANLVYGRRFPRRNIPRKGPHGRMR
jgi:hypothetical protein